MQKQKTQVVRMTPDMARDILKHNQNNRNVKRERVNLYATDMEKGRWQLNGESIVIDADGNLKDGQHRLLAVVKSQCTVPMVLVTGVDADCNIYDRGSGRSVRDILSMTVEEKWKYSNQIIAVANRFMYLKKGIRSSNSDFDVIKFIDTYEEELRQVYHIAVVKAKYSRQATIASAIFLALHNGESAEKLIRYTDVLNSGIMAEPTDSAAIMVRNACYEKKITGYRNREGIAIILKSIEDFGTYARKKPYSKCDTAKVDTFIEEMKRKGL